MIRSLVWGLLSCTHRAPDPPPPDVDRAVIEVLTSLDEAVERAALGDRDAEEAWVRSHDLFEEAIEPTLRARWPAVDVARTEYGFGLVHAALQGGGDPVATVDALAERLNQQLRSAETP
ncbi:MAG TPA: hypothetical protein ENK18_14235 [Deltaproteobacteria bacterium]|nr:hypothetical protein [Deltaproteobacteria bacterium]